MRSRDMWLSLSYKDRLAGEIERSVRPCSEFGSINIWLTMKLLRDTATDDAKSRPLWQSEWPLR